MKCRTRRPPSGESDAEPLSIVLEVDMKWAATASVRRPPSCVDWELINHGEDEAAVQKELRKRDDYDRIMAAELERELLEPGLPALIYTGIAHSTARIVEYWFDKDEPLVRMCNMVYCVARIRAGRGGLRREDPSPVGRGRELDLVVG